MLDNKALADNFAEVYRGVSSDHNISPDILSMRKDTVNKFFRSYNSDISKGNMELASDKDLINKPFELAELETVLMRVNIKSSPGIDEIPYLYIIKSPLIVKKFILYIINLSWKEGQLPDKFKHTIIKPILKPHKGKNEFTSYRPISLTISVCKIFEKMIVNRLNWFLEKHNLLNIKQSGFRKNCCTSDPIIRLKNEVETAVSSGNLTVAVLIDFTRAFDLLWIDGLLLKLLEFNIVGNMFKWIKNFLLDRKYQVKVGEKLSFVYSTDNGTPQGSTLSPLLFLIMINDFPKLSKYTDHALFADDSTIWRSGNNLSLVLNHIQNDLDILGKWCNKWGFVINTDKTTAILFTNKKINSKDTNLKIQGSPITFQNKCTLLGVVFDSKMTWKPHIDFLVDKTKKRLNLMKCVSGARWGANSNVLLTLYKALILSHIDYCSFVYSSASQTNLKRVDSIQYKALAIVLGAMKDTAGKALLEDCGDLPLCLRRDKLLLRYLFKLYNIMKKCCIFCIIRYVLLSNGFQTKI